MAINRTSQYKGYKEQPLQEKVVYLWKVVSATPVEAATSGNLYVRVRAEVTDGPSKGYVASFPNYQFMMINAHDEVISERYQSQSMDAAYRILGEFPPAIFPTEAGEETGFTLSLEGALFEATVKPSDNPHYWEFDEVYGPPKSAVEDVDPEHHAAVITEEEVAF